MKYRPKKSEAQKKIERDERIIERNRMKWEKWHREHGKSDSGDMNSKEISIIEKLEDKSNGKA
jgi:acyl-CoA-binding protein